MAKQPRGFRCAGHMEPMPFSLDGEARFIGVQNRGSQQLLLNGFPQLLEPGGRFLNDIVDASLTDGSVQPFLEQLNKPGRKKELHRMEVGDQRTDAPAVLDMVRDVRWKFRLFEPSAAGA